MVVVREQAALVPEDRGLIQQDGGHMRVLALLVVWPISQRRVRACVWAVCVEDSGAGESGLDGGLEIALLADDGADKDVVVLEKSVRGCGPPGLGEELGCEVTVLVRVVHRGDEIKDRKGDTEVKG